jgi:hypothetical protein
MSVPIFDVVNKLTDDRDLVFRFFAVFSRFECALKRADFFKRGLNDAAQPDWERFSQTLQGRFGGIQNAAFGEACARLLTKPPQKQVVDGQALRWKASTRVAGECEEAYILRLVRTVRNNLFHGGKYPWPDQGVEDAARNRGLLEASLVVLNECLALNAALGETFSEWPNRAVVLRRHATLKLSAGCRQGTGCAVPAKLGRWFDPHTLALSY